MSNEKNRRIRQINGVAYKTANQNQATMTNSCATICGSGLVKCLPLGFLVIYSIIGAFLFNMIEGPEEIKLRKELSRNLSSIRNEMLNRIKYVEKNYPDGELRDEMLSREILWLHEKVGVSEEDGPPKWSFLGSLFYSMTLYSTVGYGSLYPKTIAGQIATIIYSLIGIPLTLATLVQLGSLLSSIIIFIWRACRSVGGVLPKPPIKLEYKNLVGADFLNVVDEEERRNLDLLDLPLSFLIFISVAWVMISAGLFLLWENWDFFTSFYFTIISFTTVGLGDVTPTNEPYMTLVIIFVLFGIALLSTIFALVQEKIDCLQDELDRMIEKNYLASQLGGDLISPMTGDDKEIDAEIQRMVKSLPWSSRILYWMMSDKKKNQLKKSWRQKAKNCAKSTQTEEKRGTGPGNRNSLVLRRIEEADDTRSHDDVNSLVALCDYAIS